MKHGGGMRVMPQEDGWNIWGGALTRPPSGKPDSVEEVNGNV